ncbi:MAG: rhamnulokinase [Acetatifactor sp.]|nr:rhamnulokinase [Acetatifactor sp.]
MGKYYLAIDIGASGGRHILGHVEDGKLITEEIYRFPNGLVEKNGHKCWDVDELFRQIINGLRKCKERNLIPSYVGIDTWAVDFVLLDENGERIGDAVGYRDNRTQGMDAEVYKVITEAALYQRTGIQKQLFNTIYQLMAVKKNSPENLKQAKMFLMIPDYFNYQLTGKAVAEYTNATTTQLIHAETNDWDSELMDALGFPREIFQEIHKPGYVLGNFREEIKKQVGFDAQVVLVATHDTGSAVMAVPSEKENIVYISSGTWSLMGTELKKANCSEISGQHNFTNEGGYDYRFRYLKNIMGLWMIQSVRKEMAPQMDYGEICEGASGEKIKSIVDCNDSRFLSPESMVAEVQKACRESGQEVPENIFEVAAVVYNSLAVCYAKVLDELERISGHHYEQIHVIGGGANAEYLNQLTATKCGCNVCAGPVEATAIGNLSAQMIAAGEFATLPEARNCIKNSFEIKNYEP